MVRLMASTATKIVGNAEMHNTVFYVILDLRQESL